MIGACAARFDPAVEAAMLRTYGVDTLGPGLSPRRVWVLLSNMPAGAVPQWTDSAAAWSVESHLLATLLDAVNMLTWVQVAKASKRKPKQPKPVDRPGRQSVRRTEGLNIRDLARVLSGQEGVVGS